MRKRLTEYILFLLTVLSISACHDDSEPAIHSVDVNTQIIGADTVIGVTIRAVIECDVEKSSIDYVTLKISEDIDMSHATEIQAKNVNAMNDTFICIVPGLKRDTKYYYSYKIGNYLSHVTTQTKSFNIDKNFNLANVWSQVAPFTGGLRSGGIAFSLKDKGYYGLGKSSSRGEDKYYNDLWQYDPTTDKWSHLNNFPSTGLDMAISFVIDDVAYVALGRYYDQSINGYNTTTYAYEVATDNWKKMQPFPGIGRTGSVSFVANGKGYVVGGYREKEAYTNEIWCFDPQNNSWSQKNNFPLALTGCFTFTLNGEVYVGGGYNLKENLKNTTLYKYDIDTDSWRIAYSDCEVLIYSTGFSSGDKCYVAGGEGEMGKESLFMSFDGKEWSTMGSFGEIRKKSSSFVLNGSFYLVCGENDVNAPQNSVLKYSIK